MARRDRVHRPVSGVGRLNGSLLSCLRKDVALVSHCVSALRSGDDEDDEECWVTAHFMCTVRCEIIGANGFHEVC
ncbi:hypothetical protein [Desulfosporosinus sp. SB140]|uniref:hypothetical protein n=1 Tax=Desulfosporosinus paludis TaxID=3115649 RepID=UPI00388E69DC